MTIPPLCGELAISDPVCCAPADPQVIAPENHLRQVDVNDLLTKLISNGIIKPPKPDAVPPAGAGQLANSATKYLHSDLEMFLLFLLKFILLSETSVSAAPAASPPAAEEEDEDDPEVEDNDTPDLTSFTIDDMKQ